MEKKFKPVPDVDCLQYHGTPEQPDIKIFVSHRIDQDSETIDNPLYIPVRCGAVYDEREGVTMLGDDTGDNISEKRNSYCELTVQYWAWKNVKADYYGLCTAEKYLNFKTESGNTKCGSKKFGLEEVGSVDELAKLANIPPKRLQKMLLDNDVIALQAYDLAGSASSTVNQFLLDDIYHYDTNIITNLLKVIQYKFPKFLPVANRYFTSSLVQTDLLFIAKREVFFEYCQFQFAVLESLSKKINMEYAGTERKKMFSHLASHLWGIFLNYLEKGKYKVKRVAGARCKNTEKQKVLEPAFSKNNVPIVFSSSNDFAPYLGVALKSMLSNASVDSNYDVIVLEKNIKTIEKKRIWEICSKYKNVSVRFANVNALVASVNFFVPTKDLSEETYYTILVPWVLANYEKALVLDCDIIINHDVADLYNTDLKNNYLGAVKEIVYLGFLNNPRLNINNSLVDYTEMKLRLENPYDYFNAGVLLMNLKKFRKELSMEYLLDLIDKNRYSIVEQDVLNSVCAGRVMFLDYSWNFMSCLTSPELLGEEVSPSDTTIPNLKLAPEKEVDLYEKASEHPCIYHYLTRYKPWKYPWLQYAEIWWKVARETPYYETFISRLAEPKKEKIYLRETDGRSRIRKFADKLFPLGSRRRKALKRVFPQGTRFWNFGKKIYYKLGGK